MNRFLSCLKTLSLLSFLTTPGWAQKAENPRLLDAPHILAEIDPATFALGGYSAHARIELGQGSKWVIGAGVYALDLPKAMVDFDSKNRDKGWDVRLKFGAGVFADRFLSEDHVGPFVGVQAATQQYRLRNSRAGSGEAQYTSMLLMPRFGYLWKPGSSELYIMPWAGVGYANKVSGEAHLAGVDYHLSKVMVFATVHVGWRF